MCLDLDRTLLLLLSGLFLCIVEWIEVSFKLKYIYMFKTAHYQKPPAPSYLSQSKAEAILSEVRPTKVKTDTLICVNVFLDELLWLVLSTARSFSTDRLKIGLLKTLPTSLGKDALLEAEVELKAYWEKTGINALRALENSPSPSPSEFPLQAAFEVRHPNAQIIFNHRSFIRLAFATQV